MRPPLQREGSPPRTSPATAQDAAGNGTNDDHADADADGADRLLRALNAALARRQTHVTLCLLRHVPQNFGTGPGPRAASAERLGKIADQQVRRTTFRSTPVHLVAIAGDPMALRALLRVRYGEESGEYPSDPGSPYASEQSRFDREGDTIA